MDTTVFSGVLLLLLVAKSTSAMSFSNESADLHANDEKITIPVRQDRTLRLADRNMSDYYARRNEIMNEYYARRRALEEKWNATASVSKLFLKKLFLFSN